MIKTINLTKSFDNFVALKNLNLEIKPGEIFAFLGPNGAGKTTTIKLLSGLLKPTSGKALICGYDTQENPIQVKKLIGLLPDHPFIYSKLTGIEFLRLVGDLYNILPEVQKNRIPELINMFDLDDFANELIETYSQGMRQKIIIANILLRQPKVLLLDEPLIGLDPKSARLVKNIFIESAKQGTIVFMCTHILEIAEKLAHRIGIIHQGELIALGTKEELRKKASGLDVLEDIYIKLTEGKEYADL